MNATMVLVFYPQHAAARIQQEIRSLAEVSHWRYSQQLIVSAPYLTPSTSVETAAELIRRQPDNAFLPA